MSAFPCPRCGKLVLRAKDRETCQMVILTNQAAIWRAIPSKTGPLVVREPKLLSAHYCTQPDQPPATMPDPDRNFTEPRESL